MQVTKKLFLIFIMLSVVILVAQAQALKPPTMKILTDPTIDDTVKVTVTVGEMRAALWYYNNYYIQKEANAEKSNVISGYMDLTGEYRDAIQSLNKKQWYEPAFWGVSGAFLSLIALEFAGVL